MEAVEGAWALEATTDCVLLLDANLRIVYVNRCAADLNDTVPEALVGRLHGEVWPQTVGTEVERRYRQALETGAPQVFEHHYLGDVGPEVWHEIHATPHAGGVAVFFRDLTPLVRREEAVGAERARLERALDVADIGVWSRDLSGGEPGLYWSCRMREHFGLAPDEGVGPDTFDAHVHPDDRERSLDAYRRAISEHVPYESIYRTVGTDGRVRTVHARGGAIYAADGSPLRFDGFTLDVTRRQGAERRQRFRVELVDALRGLEDAREIVGVACRMIGDFLEVSRTTFGVVDDAAKTIDTLTPYAEGVEPLGGLYTFETYGRGLLDEVRKGVPLAVADAAADPLTRDRYVEVYRPRAIRSFVVVPLLRGDELAATFAVHDRIVRPWTPEERELLENVAGRTWDALQRARAEDRLRTLNAELEDRVRERTAELQRANDELQAFTSAVSHDLRGPLRNIHGLGQMLLEDAADRLTPDDRRLLERQAHNAMRLSAMVDGLLSLARLSREPLTAAPFDLSALAESVRDDFLSRDPSRACGIEIAPGLQAVGDRRLVRSVLQNLMENACKFSPNGGAVRVGQEPDGAFFVSDDGVGFDMAYVAKLFQPFERLVSEKEFPGTGIGLANVRRIVERHGGRVWAESAPGCGATFRFTLGE